MEISSDFHHFEGHKCLKHFELISSYILALSFEFAGCSDYTWLIEANRNYQFKYDSNFPYYCDHYFDLELGITKFDGPGWYDFGGLAGERLPENPVDSFMCQSYVTGWMNGQHPVKPGQRVERTVCFHYKEITCNWQTKIRVQHCRSYYIYYLPNTPFCSFRYCAQ